MRKNSIDRVLHFPVQPWAGGLLLLAKSNEMAGSEDQSAQSESCKTALTQWSREKSVETRAGKAGRKIEIPLADPLD
jgi:hypothetical protein